MAILPIGCHYQKHQRRNEMTPLQKLIIAYIKERGSFMVWWAGHNQPLIDETSQDQKTRRKLLNNALSDLAEKGIIEKVQKHANGYIWKLKD